MDKGVYPKYRIKLLSLGDSSVGKSALILRWQNGEFEGNRPNTVAFDFNRKIVDVEGVKVVAQVWDTAGQEKFRSMTNGLYRGTQAVLFVYDLTDEKTLTNIKAWVASLAEIIDLKKVVCILCGNKCDIIKDKQRLAELEEKGKEMSEKMNMFYFITSAKTNHNVEKAFYTAISRVKLMLDKNKEQSLSRYKPSVVIGSPKKERQKEKSGCCSG